MHTVKRMMLYKNHKGTTSLCELMNIWNVCVLVAQSCPNLCDPMDCSPPGFSVHGILQARILECKNTGVDCHSLLQRNFPTQESNPGLLRGWQILYRFSYREVTIGINHCFKTFLWRVPWVPLGTPKETVRLRGWVSSSSSLVTVEAPSLSTSHWISFKISFGKMSSWSKRTQHNTTQHTLIWMILKALLGLSEGRRSRVR